LVGLVEHHAAGICLTSMGRLLLEGDAGVRERAMLVGEEYLPAWQDLRYSVITGKPAFENGFGITAWEHRRQHPELNECMNRTMADDHRRSGHSISAAYDFSECRLVVDVGGGQGALIAEILMHCPHTDGLVFDQPHVVEGAGGILSAAGVQDRCRVVAGSFFESVPAGGDTYILQHILHDWNDERCEAVLRNCRAAMSAASSLLVIENIMPDDADPVERLVMLDLHMMVMLGGRERTRSEFRAMLRRAGLELVRSVSARAQTEILVATPSGAPV
jgi:orsellinic acid C2-O-methyltransferase